MGKCLTDNFLSGIGITLFDVDYLENNKKNNAKQKIGESHVLYMLNRTQAMFDYEGLPETIPARNLEIILQLNGNCFATKVNGDYYVFAGGLGGEPDVYYEPTIYTVANPALNFSKCLEIDKDGVLIRNDSYGVGLLPMFKKYASLLTENEITMRVCDITTRMAFLLSAADDRTKASAEQFLERILDGKLGVISDNAFLESLKVNPTTSNNAIRLTDLIEYQQYLKAAWFNDLGINANYNMKRESISPNEAQLNDDALLPLVDDMLEARKLGIEKFNNMYGLDVKVSLSSSWLKEQLSQTVPGVDFDSDNDELINEQVPENSGESLPEEVITDQEEVTTDPEEVTTDQEEVTTDPEEVTTDPEEETAAPESDIVDVLEDISDELGDIADSLNNEGGEQDEPENVE